MCLLVNNGGKFRTHMRADKRQTLNSCFHNSLFSVTIESVMVYIPMVPLKGSPSNEYCSDNHPFSYKYSRSVRLPWYTAL